MKTRRAATRSRQAHPVACALRRARLDTLNLATMDLQTELALEGLAAGRLSEFDAYVLTAVTSISRKLALQGVGPEVLACATWCQALLVRAIAGQTLRVDQVQAFRDLIAWHQAQRDADPEGFRTAALPYIR